MVGDQLRNQKDCFSLQGIVESPLHRINRDDIPHTIMRIEGVFKSKLRDTDEEFS
jgi:hypothetical protein